MTQTITLTIIGLERTGSSVALALRRCNRREKAAQHFEVTGSDPRPGILETAQRAKPCDKIGRHPADAARGRDIVVLALPITEQRRVWQGLAEALQPGAVVLDMALLKAPAFRLAQEYLPAEAHLVQLTPVVNARYLFDGRDDAEHAAEDLFDDSSMMLMPASSAEICPRKRFQRCPSMSSDWKKPGRTAFDPPIEFEKSSEKKATIAGTSLASCAAW